MKDSETNQRTDKVYIRLDDEEVFIKDRKNGMFYNKGMQCFKDKGHLVSEFTEELLDSLVEKGLFKRVIAEKSDKEARSL